MEEVRSGLLLGSMGDAMAVVSRVPSITKRYTVTHILTLTNHPPDWLTSEGGVAGSGDGEGCVAESGDVSEGEEGVTASCDVSEKNEGERVCDGAESEEDGGARVPRGGGGNPFKTMYVCVADMPTADLLHHFEACAKFIKVGVEQGTILVHCEYGISRSATVVLAYLMWSECLPLKMALQDLKARKPGIRPNAGFMEQLKLWEGMRCRVDSQNKAYRAYRLKLKAQEMKETGYVESMNASPDPAQTVLESAAYFRCRKCRRLLFTSESVLQHELGEGQAAFKRHKHSRQDPLPPTCTPRQGPATDQTIPASSDSRGGARSTVEETANKRGQTLGEGPPQSAGGFSEIETALTDLTFEGHATTVEPSTAIQPPDSRNSHSTDQSSQNKPTPSDVQEPEATLTPTPPTPTTPPPLTPTELARVRAHVASVVALGNQSTDHVSQACSSYFLEPVEWMEPALLGSVEGKILCPKCSARLGSFNWSGEQCSCGQWVTPSFQVHRSRVDVTRTLTHRKGIKNGVCGLHYLASVPGSLL